jgi:hypothetical protein
MLGEGRKTARRNRDSNGRHSVRAASLLLLGLRFLLRLGAYDPAVDADAFIQNDIEATAFGMRPNRTDFMPEAFLAGFLGRTHDVDTM